jgi:hypothetical protein
VEAIIVSIVLAVVAAFSLWVAFHQYRLNRSQHLDTALKETIKQVVKEANEPLKEAINTSTTQWNQHGDRLNRVESVIKDNSDDLRVMSEKLSQMGVKVDTYWNSLEQLAMNAAKGLHQPDPARAHIDHLLEAFMEGTLTADEKTELKKLLVKIRNYEPSGPPLEFPVHPGEQTFAAILLSTMDLVDPKRISAMGHTAHRSAREKGAKGE